MSQLNKQVPAYASCGRCKALDLVISEKEKAIHDLIINLKCTIDYLPDQGFISKLERTIKKAERHLPSQEGVGMSSQYTIKTDSSDIAEELKKIGPVSGRTDYQLFMEIIERLNRIDSMVYEMWENTKETK